MSELIPPLRTIYGEEATSQAQRYAEALSAFASTYGAGEVLIFRAPGRVNLIGEHTDYNHGYVLPVALDRDTLLLARPRSDATVRLSNMEAEFSPRAFTIGPDIPPDPPGDWGNYARGAAQALARQLRRADRRPPLRGLDGLVVGGPPHGVPRGAGLSSSSVLTVVVALALAHVNGWQPDGVTLARFCSEAEWYVGTRGGIMDQFIALLARRGHALFLDCRPDTAGRYRMEHVPLPQGYHLLIADSGVRHGNVRGHYNRRVAACRAGVALLRARFPAITHLRDVQEVPWAELEPFLPEEVTVGELAERGIELEDVPGLTPDTRLRVRARCRHVWTENRRVQAAVAALRAGQVATLGRLLNEAHASARDDYEISCPELEVLVQAAQEADGVAGARLTGAGWGGCIVALVRDDAVPAFEAHVARRYQAETGRTPAIFACRSGPGAGLVIAVTLSEED
ncbi:MAG: galactokinase [Anaerolineae bacterium]|nr:galactokinase [Anaerolineae bacterium]